MKNHYFETRGRTQNPDAKAASDSMRHWHARLNLGKAVIVCEDPTLFQDLAQRQWLRLSRDLQRRRELSLGADQILRFTNIITRMQHLRFTAQPPHEQPEADLYFVRPEQLQLLPANCFTIYLAMLTPVSHLSRIISELPSQSLVVDYCDQLETGSYGLRPKAELEFQVRASWDNVTEFLNARGIDIAACAHHYSDAFNDALDTLLDAEPDFLHIASHFQRAIDLARPLLVITKAEREQYETLARLAYQVQALSLGNLTYDFLSIYSDDSFFMHDRRLSPEPVEDLVARHYQAGRWNLARALMGREPHPLLTAV